MQQQHGFDAAGLSSELTRERRRMVQAEPDAMSALESLLEVTRSLARPLDLETMLEIVIDALEKIKETFSDKPRTEIVAVEADSGNVLWQRRDDDTAALHGR